MKNEHEKLASFSTASTIREIHEYLDDRYRELVRLEDCQKKNNEHIASLKRSLKIARQIELDEFFDGLAELDYSVEVYERVDGYLEHNEFLNDEFEDEYLSEVQERDAWNYFWKYRQEFEIDNY